MTKQSIQDLENGLPRSLAFARNDGFTLAEVLITLVIIGVIAAITAPTLIVKYQKEQTVTRLKKAYSSLAQTTARAITDNGPMNTWEMGEAWNGDDAKIFFDKYVTPYLNIIKQTEGGESSTWPVERYYLSGSKGDYLHSEAARFYMADGTSVTGYISGCAETSTFCRLQLYIDINADRKPNKFGRDIFEFHYTIYNQNNPEHAGKFIPSGYGVPRETILDNGQWKCNKNSHGTACSGLIITDGWQIKDDYPW